MLIKSLSIDFGTCNIKCSVVSDKEIFNSENQNQIEMVNNLDPTDNSNSECLSNVVLYDATGQISMGLGAEENAKLSDESNCVRNIKRKLGDENFNQYIACLDKYKNATEITEDIFRYLRKIIIDMNGGSPIDDVYLSYPVIWSERQKRILKKSAENVGFNVKALIQEPVVAIFNSHKYFQPDFYISKSYQHVFVFDFGGGTLDMSLLLISYDKDNSKYNVKNLYSKGLQFGGLDIDKVIYDFICQKCERIKNINGSKYDNLMEQIVNLKCEVSTSYNRQTTIDIYDIPNEEDIHVTVSSKDIQTALEEVGFFDNLKETIQDMFNYYNDEINEGEEIEIEDIKNIEFVGGSSQIIFIRDFIKSIFSSFNVDNQENDNTPTIYSDDVSMNITTDELSLVDDYEEENIFENNDDDEEILDIAAYINSCSNTSKDALFSRIAMGLSEFSLNNYNVELENSICYDIGYMNNDTFNTLLETGQSYNFMIKNHKVISCYDETLEKNVFKLYQRLNDDIVYLGYYDLSNYELDNLLYSMQIKDGEVVISLSNSKGIIKENIALEMEDLNYVKQQ